MTELSIYFVGSDQSEFSSCAAALGLQSNVMRFENLGSAAAGLADADAMPELFVLMESRPGQFSIAAIHELRRQAPLARVWRLTGSWCEGEKRTGKPPAGCIHTLWHQWPPRAARAVASALAGGCPPWALPITATPDEQTLALAEQPLAQSSGRVVVCAHHVQTAGALADTCRAGGYDAQVVSEAQPWSAAGARAVLWDMPAYPVDEPSIEKLRASAGGVPILALVSFPRASDVQWAAEAGIAAVISKPFLLRDLLWHIEQVASPTDDKASPSPAGRRLG